jgi:cytochrome c-type biogenesis protein CcmH
MFWLIALLIILVTGLGVMWPLLQGDSRWKASGLILLLVLPALVYWQYQLVGSPRALESNNIAATPSQDASLEDLVLTLQQKLTESAADLEGWVLLGRSYKTLQDYPAALKALETANRLVPNEPVVLVELVEAQLFASGNPQITAEMVQILQQAVALQPDLQKGWWLLGLAAAQQGDDAQAIAYWQKLLQGMEPGSSVAQTVQAQIAEAQARMQSSVPTGTGREEPQAAWQSATVRVELDESANATLGQMPSTAALFLIARVPGESAGPPLAVKRINQPSFPMEISLTDADSMLPQRPVSGFTTLQLQARLSITGEALASSGDWQSQAAILSKEQQEDLNLLINQQVE